MNRWLELLNTTAALVATLIAIITGIPAVILLFKKSRLSKTFLKRRKQLLYAATSITVGCALTATIILFFPTLIDPCQSTDVTITEPPDSKKVAPEHIITGTINCLKKDHSLWVIVHPEGTSSYYPQKDLSLAGGSGRWNVTGHFGLNAPKDNNRDFTILAVVADHQADQTFREYLAHTDANYVGISAIPEGAIVHQQATVIRQEVTPPPLPPTSNEWYSEGSIQAINASASRVPVHLTITPDLSTSGRSGFAWLNLPQLIDLTRQRITARLTFPSAMNRPQPEDVHIQISAKDTDYHYAETEWEQGRVDGRTLTLDFDSTTALGSGTVKWIDRQRIKTIGIKVGITDQATIALTTPFETDMEIVPIS